MPSRACCQRVVAGVHAALRLEEPPGAAARPGDGRVRVHPVALDPLRLAEARVFGGQPEVESAPLEVVDVQQQLRHAVVRLRLRRRPGDQRLVGLRPREQRVGSARPGEPSLARQSALRGQRNAGGEVREIGGVGHRIEVEVARQPGQLREGLVVFPGNEVAVGPGLLVVVEVRTVELARPLGIEIAELPTELQPALAHEAGDERRVVVGREIEVVRRRQFESAAHRRTQDRRQEPALALPGQRELDPRRVADGHAEEVQRRIAAGANLARLVEVHLLERDEPVLARGGAGRVAGVGDLVAIRSRELEVGGRAARTVLAEIEVRVAKEPDLGVALEAELRAGHPVDALAQDDRALAPDLVGQDVVAQPVGADRLRPGAQLDPAFGLEVLLGDPLDAVGPDEHRAVVGLGRRRLLRPPRRVDAGQQARPRARGRRGEPVGRSQRRHGQRVIRGRLRRHRGSRQCRQDRDNARQRSSGCAHRHDPWPAALRFSRRRSTHAGAGGKRNATSDPALLGVSRCRPRCPGRSPAAC